MTGIVGNECCQYLDIALFAENFVDSIIQEAESTITTETGQKSFSVVSTENYEFRSSVYSAEYYTFIDEKREFSSWPTIEKFTIKLGAAKINEYLSSFPVVEEWLYAIYFLRTREERVSSLHEYEAIWSLPTRYYPIAQATASVFFTIEVSKVLPKRCPVQVTYRLETNSTVHEAEISKFNEKWLMFILDAKIKFFQKVHY
nr:A-kinase anchor protein 14-like [Leptinotarsa decemlineata]